MEVLTMKLAMKILAALAAIVGVVYVIATYGDKIVAWAKNLLSSYPCCKSECEIVEEDFVTEEAPAEAPAAEEAPVEEEAPVAEGPEVEIVVQSNEPVAEEGDFEA
jgi:hypothetical protein